MINIIVTRVLAFLMGRWGSAAIIGSFVVMIGLSASLGVQTWRLSNAQGSITKLEQVISAKDALIIQLNNRIIADDFKIKQRDSLIQEQNAAVVRITTEALQNEKNYKARIEQARQKNQGLERRISEIQAIPDQTNLSDAEVLQIIRDTIKEYQESRR